jgi:hypothetical protein
VGSFLSTWLPLAQYNAPTQILDGSPREAGAGNSMMFIQFAGRYCRCVTGGSNLGRTFWPSRVGLRCTQQPLYNFLEDKNIIGYSYPDDGRETQPSGLSTACPFYMGWMHRCHWSEERGVADMPNKKYTIYLARGKRISGWLDRGPPSRDLPVHDPGWHRTGNFPMLTGGLSRPLDPPASYTRW